MKLGLNRDVSQQSFFQQNVVLFAAVQIGRYPKKDLHKTFYHHLQGRIGFNTINPVNPGKDYPMHSLRKD